MSVGWWPAPEAGDIVWCHFPESIGLTRAHQPGPKPRPGLVVQVFDDQDPHFFVLLAYGTSQKTHQLRSGEFLISPHETAAYRLAGLSYPTKFNFHNIVELPYNTRWFKVPPGPRDEPTPKLGVLHPSLMPRVRAAWDAAQ